MRHPRYASSSVQQFGFSSGPVTDDRMTDAEAQEVLRLHLQRTDGAPELSVEDVAEAIRLPAEDVQSLLAEVRRQKGVAEQAAPQKQRKLRDTRLALAAAVLAIAIAIGLIGWTARGFRSVNAQATEASSAETGSGFMLTIGNWSTFVSSAIDPKNASANGNLVEVIDNKVVEKTRMPHMELPKQTITDQELLKELKRGNWDASGIGHLNFGITLAQQPSVGDRSFSLPFYMGRSAEVRRIVQEERQWRIRHSLENIAKMLHVRDGD